MHDILVFKGKTSLMEALRLRKVLGLERVNDIFK